MRRALERRIAAPALLCGVAGIVAVAAWCELDAVAAARLERDAKIELAERLARTMPQRRGAAPAGPAPFVSADTETLAAAELDRLVRASVGRASGVVLSSRASAARSGDGPLLRI